MEMSNSNSFLLNTRKFLGEAEEFTKNKLSKLSLSHVDSNKGVKTQRHY